MNIIKRKVKNHTYYYLHHTYRENNKVKTKELYLGKTIPTNIEKIKQEFKMGQQKELQKKLETIKQHFKKEWNRTPKEAKEQQLKEIAIAFTYNTNAIEGSTITLHETREIIENNIAPNKSLYDIKETESHMEVFLNILKKQQPITNKLILYWHNQLFEQTKPKIAGVYRDYLVRVGSYIAPDWQDVKNMMNALLKQITNKKENPVIHTAKVHYQFEKIHPFGDGNGRLGRLLMNYMLWHAGYPMLIIEYKKRSSYYKALSGDEEKFVKYFVRRYVKVHGKRCPQRHFIKAKDLYNKH
jgi:Fic family protein